MSQIPQGRAVYFNEINVGDSIESLSRVVTVEDIQQFAGLTGDTNPLHVDAEYAKTTMFGQQIAHGLLGLAFAVGMAWQTGFMDGTVEAFTGLDWKFRTPIYIGDTIRLRAEVTKKRERSSLGAGFATFSVVLLNQRDEVTQKGTWTILIRIRPEE